MPLYASQTQVTIDGTVSVDANFDSIEDTPHVTGDAGAFILAVRNDAGTPLAADGDYIPFTTDSSGSLRVAASVAINYAYPEDSAHISGSIGSFILAVRNDGGVPLAGDGEYIPFTTDASGALRVAASVAINYAYAEDSVHVSGDIGSFSLGVRNDAGATLTSTNGDYSPFSTDDAGRIGITDLGGSVSIDDNGGSITVDGAVTVTGTVTADTNFDYNEDTAHSSGDIGAFVLAVRNDAGTPLSANGEYIPFTTDSSGALRVAATVTINAEKAEDSVHTTGDIGSFVLGVRNDAAAVITSTNGDYSPFSTDDAGRIGITDLGGSISVDDNGGSITVDGAVTVSGTVTADTNFDYSEDTIHASGDMGAFILAVRNDAGTPLAADGEYIPFTTDSSGSLRVAASVTINSEKAEDAAHTTGDIGSFTLGVRNDAAAALTSTDGDYSPFATDSAGRIGITDLGGSISIDDNAGSITVDGTVAVTQSTSPWVTSLDAASLAALESITVQNGAGGAAVNIQDGGNSITVDGAVTVSGTVTSDTNFDFAEDSVHVSGDIGAFVLAVRNDASTALAADGDYSPLQVDSTGGLRIAGTVAIASPVELGATSLAALESITVQNGAGGAAVNIQDGGNSITVDGSVSITGTVTTASERAEDGAHTTGEIGSFVLGVRNDTIDTVVTSTNGDYSPISVDSAGRVGTRDNKAEDAVHASGDIGSFVLAVRNDAGTPLAASGDYIPLTTDASGDVFVTTGRNGSLANGTATTTASGAAVSALAANTARKKLILQNTGAGNLRVGVTGVTTTTGFRLVPGGSMILEMPNCPTNEIFIIRETATNSTLVAMEIT